MFSRREILSSSRKASTARKPGRQGGFSSAGEVGESKLVDEYSRPANIVIVLLVVVSSLLDDHSCSVPVRCLRRLPLQ